MGNIYLLPQVDQFGHFCTKFAQFTKTPLIQMPLECSRIGWRYRDSSEIRDFSVWGNKYIDTMGLTVSRPF